VIGILAALQARATSQTGQWLDLSLLESQAAYLAIVAGDYFATGQAPEPIGNAHPGIVPYQVFKAADKHVIIAVGSDKQWAALCGVLGLGDDVRGDPRFTTNVDRLANREVLVPMLEGRIAGRQAHELLGALRAAEIPCGPINTLPEVLADAHYQARENIVHQPHPVAGEVRSLANPVRLGETPVSYRLPPPSLGEHTADVLREMGVGTQTLMELRARGVI
jgi:crotonobetainyl-CoA:carnitine CoA-transferase CaiB-like acyl-CoA transferase